MGPITIFHKSALQSLSMDESVWLDAFFLVNTVPLFYIETVADLEKKMAEGKSPEDLVGMLTAKTPPNSAPNVHHRSLISAELTGWSVPMDGRIPIAGGDMRLLAAGDPAAPRRARDSRATAGGRLVDDDPGAPLEVDRTPDVDQPASSRVREVRDPENAVVVAAERRIEQLAEEQKTVVAEIERLEREQRTAPTAEPSDLIAVLESLP